MIPLLIAAKTTEVDVSGNVYVWGEGDSGVIGDGTTADKSSPVQVGSLVKWSVIVACSDTNYGVRTDGTLWGWGQNNVGQIGINNLTTPMVAPIQEATGKTDWSLVGSKISATLDCIFAIDTAGKLWSWGLNDVGQLGHGDTTTRSSPVQVGSLTDWSKVGTTNSSVAFIKTDGTLWTCGAANTGQTGQGNTTNLSSPAQVGSLTNWAEIAGGTAAHWAVKTDGTLWSWGGSIQGGLGNGTTSPNLSSPVQVGSLTTWSKISGRGYNGVALKTDSTIWSWGYNAAGGVGDSSTVGKSSPVQVGGPAYASLGKMSTGGSSCAIASDGSLWVWGENSAGELGVGDTTDRSSPTQVGSLTTWATGAIGNPGNAGHFLTNTGELYGTGAGDVSGHIGNGTISVSYSSPVQVGNHSPYKAVEQGERHVLAITDAGTMWSWGDNSSEGSIGDGTVVDKSFPVQIGSGITWVEGSSGFVTAAAIDDAGRLYTWGDNNDGKLGDGSTTDRSAVTQLGSLTNWAKITVGQRGMTAVKTDGTLWQWGEGGEGLIGDGTTTTRSSPVQIGGLTTWSKPRNGNKHAGALKTDGTIWCWGDNGNGQLGNSATADKSSPVQFGSLSTWADFTCCNGSTIAVKTDGTLWSAGLNSNGELGQGDATNRSSPTQIGSLVKWSTSAGAHSVSSQHALAIRTDGTLWGWGIDSSGEQGQSTSDYRDVDAPMQVANDNTFSKTAAGLNTSAVIDTSGKLWTWGEGGNGELGNGSTTDISSPVQVGGLTTWTRIAGGNSHFLGITSDGKMWAWGDNTTHGQLGDGSTTDRSSPVQVGALTTWASVACGELFSAAIKTDGTLWTWGRNNVGQLGHGGTTTISSPVQVGSLTTWSKIQIGGSFAVALKTDGTLWSWGSASNGRTGLGDTTNRSSPVQIGSLTNWDLTEGGNAQGVAGFSTVKTDGTLWSWGRNTDGQLGHGGTTDVSSPVQVGSLTTWSKSFMRNSAMMAFSTDGVMYAVGKSGAKGVLGTGFNDDTYSSPVQVGNHSPWTRVYGSAAAQGWTAITEDGTMWTCGIGTDGRIGDGSATTKSFPVQVGKLETWLDGASSGGFGSAGILNND